MDSTEASKASESAPPMVDNFTLLYYDPNQPFPSTDPGDRSKMSEEERYRSELYSTLSDIAKLRDEISNKNHARFLTEEKLKIQLNDSRNQTKHFGALSTNQSALLQAIDSNYKRLKLLYEKIYQLQVELQTMYLSLCRKLERRSERLLETHKTARLCANALYEYRNSI